MIRTLHNILNQDRETFVVPKKVQDIIPVQTIWPDGIFLSGKNQFSRTYRFSDINYAVASRADQEGMFLEYSELLNALDPGSTTKITVNNRRLNRLDFEENVLIPKRGDGLDRYREEYNRILLDKATGANAVIQDKYVTLSVVRKNVEDARIYFDRAGAELTAHFARMGSVCTELDAGERLRIIHDFLRALGGSVIEISASSPNHINAMDMSREYGETDLVIEKSQFLQSLCEQIIAGHKFSKGQQSIIDRCTENVYRFY